MKYYNQKEKIPHKTNNFPLGYYYVDKNHPRYIMRHHWHTELELIHIISGSILLTLDGREHKLCANEYALIPPGIIHSAIPDNALYECVVFDLESMVGVWKSENTYISGILTNKLDFPHIYRFPDGLPETKMEKFLNTLRKLEDGFELSAVSAALEIFSALIKSDCIFRAKEDLTSNRISPFTMSIKYIEQNFNKKISLNDIARYSGISRKYFGEYFKKFTNKTPFEYINEYRIERAAEMLLYTDLSITEIAFECGFNDTSYFSKTFKQYKKSNPRNYKKMHILGS